VKFYFVDYPPTSTAKPSTAVPRRLSDNAERFAMFSRAVLEASKILGVPQVFHCHDWQSALIPIMLRTLYAEDPPFATWPPSSPSTTWDTRPVLLRYFAAPDAAWDLLTMSKMNSSAR